MGVTVAFLSPATKVITGAYLSQSHAGLERIIGSRHAFWPSRERRKVMEKRSLCGGREKASKLKMHSMGSSGVFVMAIGRDEGDIQQSEQSTQEAEEPITELQQKARLVAERKRKTEETEALFQMGQRAYEQGVYDKSVDILEDALSRVPSTTQLGGEIQIWLAMAYEAHARHDDCLALLEQMEGAHPMIALRRQAANLRYILKAPKLKISEEEMVKIPILDANSDSGWRDRSKWRQVPKSTKTRKTDPGMDIWTAWKPPRIERNKYFWVAFGIWLTLLIVALVYQ